MGWVYAGTETWGNAMHVLDNFFTQGSFLLRKNAVQRSSVRACQSGTATPPFSDPVPDKSPPQQRGVLPKRGSRRRPFERREKKGQFAAAREKPSVSMGPWPWTYMPWSLLDGAQCILEACYWYRNQQRVRECSSKSPPVLRFSSAT